MVKNEKFITFKGPREACPPPEIWPKNPPRGWDLTTLKNLPGGYLEGGDGNAWN